MKVTVTTRVPEVTQDVEARVTKAVMLAAFAVEAHSKMKAPVDTGFLRGSIQARQTGPFSAEIGATADYAEHVEFGTTRMGARPFMGPAAKEVAAMFARIMRGIG